MLTHLKNQEERHPLIILDLSSEAVGGPAIGAMLLGDALPVLEEDGRADPRERDVHPGDAQHRTRHEVRAVNPAVGVERLDRYVPETPVISRVQIVVRRTDTIFKVYIKCFINSYSNLANQLFQLVYAIHHSLENLRQLV